MSAHAQQQMRRRIAQGAARLIAENGISDYALAKRKAARQLGAPDSHSLPSNDEVNEALCEYRSLFVDEDGAERLRKLHAQALAVMDSLQRFSPVLVGGLADCQTHGDIELEIAEESGKAFEKFLASEGIDFRSADRGRLHCFLLYSEPANVRVCIVPPGGYSRPALSQAQIKRLSEETDQSAAIQRAASSA